jgi:hypothetical protein
MELEILIELREFAGAGVTSKVSMKLLKVVSIKITVL